MSHLGPDDPAGTGADGGRGAVSCDECGGRGRGDGRNGPGGPSALYRKPVTRFHTRTRRHAYGTWSIALKNGLHPIKAIYVDYRTDAVERLNHPGLRLNTLWDGAVPVLRVSGPGVDRAPIPNEWYVRQ